jgi:DNA-binding CsgD family transcriptional regulator
MKHLPAAGRSSGAAALLERDAALAAIDLVLLRARGGSGELLLVEGHAGIGKTALIEAAVTRAREDGVTVLRARAAALESDFQFGVALRLFEPLLAGADDETRDRLLAGSAALAGPLLERPTSWAGNAGDDRLYPVTHGLFRLLANLTESGAVLIAIDDLHWADRASLRLVLYLLGRLDEMAVSFIVTRRLGEPGAPDDLLAQIATHTATRAVRPPPLSRHGARRMVAAALPGADEAFADACWRMTEGNVFLLHELVAAVRDEGWVPAGQNATRIGTLAPEAVLRAVSVRLMRLSDDAAGIARAVAVLGDEAQLRHVVALTDGTHDRVAAGADALAASDILRPLDTGALTFAHPLLASAVYADIATGERAALHRRAAEILHRERAAHERVAAHLLPTPGSGEAWVVEVLRAAARHALTTGAPESAASFLRRALDEPPAPGTRAELLRELGESEAMTGLPSAIEHLTQARDGAQSEDDRARALFALGRALAVAGAHAEALERFDEAASCGGDAVAAHAHTEMVVLGLFDPVRRDALLAAPAPSADAVARGVLGTLRGGTREDVLEQARRALGDDDAAAGDHGASALFGIGLALRAGDDLVRADRLTTDALDRARDSGSVMAFAGLGLSRAATRWAQGRLADALADAEQAVDAQSYGWRELLPFAHGVRLGVLVDRGELEAAGVAAAAYDPSPHAGSFLLAPWHDSLGRLAMGERRESDALAHFEAWGEVVEGIDNPACFAGWRSASVYPLVSLERLDEARERAREELELARAFGAPRAIAIALRAAAYAEARADLDAAIALLDEAQSVIAGSEAQLEQCRVSLHLGVVLRRGRRRADAGRALGDALELARECEARLVEERVLAELEVAGTRMQRAARRGADALSPSERRVVGLAIDGLSNRQIAEALFVTRKAVEWHLGNAYRKLDVRSRGELAGAVGEDGAGRPDAS